MNHSSLNGKDFIARITEIILENMGDENFGVKELAQKSGISKAALNKKILSANKKHVNQFIREFRLQKALELIQDEKLTAAEAAYKVGFSSPTYFNKCFHEYFGYSPGKLKKDDAGYKYSLNLIQENLVNEQVQIKKSWFSPKYTLLFILIIVISLFFISKKYYHNELTDNLISNDDRISIAVMPFQNITNDSTWNIWQIGIQTNLIASLSNVEEFRVRQIETINGIIENKGLTSNASITPLIAGSISEKLDANAFIIGNINNSGNTVRLNAQIINSKTNESVKSFQIDGHSEEILTMIDSLSENIRNTLLIRQLSKIGKIAYHEPILKTTNSPNAYLFFIQGNAAFYKNDFTAAIEWFTEALKADSMLITAMAKIALSYYNQAKYEEGKVWCGNFYKHIDRLNIKDKIWANATHAIFFKNYYERISYLRQLIEIDDQNPMVWFNIGDCYFEMEEFEKAIPEFEKALEIFKKWDTKPYWGAFYYELGICYHETGQYQKEKRLYQKADKDFPDDPGLLDQHAWLQIALGDTIEANRYIEKLRTVRKEESWSDASIAGYISYIYMRAHLPDKEEKYLRLAYSLEPDNTARINSLAYFLINTERNVSEGLQLAEKALVIRPDNYNSQMIKGLGLYKQGKYPEALKLLQSSWDLRMQKSIYNHKAFIYLDQAKKASIRS